MHINVISVFAEGCAMEKVVIIRYSELGLKSERVRRRMERALIEHLGRALPGVRVSRERGRIFLHTSSREAVERASRVFGVASVSPAEVVSAEFEELLKAGLEFALPRVRGRSFALRVRRVGEHEYRSTDIARELGRRILREADGARVELKKPEVEVFVEVRGDRAYLYDEVLRGVGGLPYGTQGKVLALVSGGIDSPVAAWMMMRRGCEVSVLFMNPQPLVDERTPKRAEQVVEVLASWASERLRMYVSPYGEVLLKLLKAEDYRMGCVLCKRMMYRVGERIAAREGALALVTGESLGQVASQTLSNLAAISASVRVPVLRPLIAMDKEEIIALARRIGTYGISVQPANCCLGPPPKPVTRATAERAESAEEGLEVEAMADELAERAELREVSPEEA